MLRASIALAIIVAITSCAGAAERRQPGPRDAFGSPQIIVECTHGVWDAYALRCDGNN
jgi:hypothetical protein